MSGGGRNTKIHTLMDGLGNPLAFMLSSGRDHDSVHAVELLQQINIAGSNILGENADVFEIRELDIGTSLYETVMKTSIKIV